MVDQIPPLIAIPLIAALWCALIVLHVQDRRRSPRPVLDSMTNECHAPIRVSRDPRVCCFACADHDETCRDVFCACHDYIAVTDRAEGSAW